MSGAGAQPGSVLPGEPAPAPGHSGDGPAPAGAPSRPSGDTDERGPGRNLAALRGAVADRWLLVPAVGLLVLAGLSQWSGPADTLRAAAVAVGATMLVAAAVLPTPSARTLLACIAVTTVAGALVTLAFPGVQQRLEVRPAPTSTAPVNGPASPSPSTPTPARSSRPAPSPAAAVSLPGADLTGTDIAALDLRRADLAGARLDGVHAPALVFEHADLSGASLRGADLIGADLSGAELTGADLSGADLAGACLRGAQLTGATVSGANFTGADVSGARLPAPLTGLRIHARAPGSVPATSCQR